MEAADAIFDFVEDNRALKDGYNAIFRDLQRAMDKISDKRGEQ